MRRRFQVSLSIYFVLFGLLFISDAAGQVKPTVTLRVGNLGSMADSPFYVGLERGYFREKGIELKLEAFKGGDEMMAPLGAGQLQVAAGGIGAGFFNAMARGFPIIIVAPRNRVPATWSMDAVMVRTDLKDKIRGPADLKGRKVAVTAPGSVDMYMMARFLETGGLQIRDVDLVYMSFPDMITAFANKAIDAAWEIEPFATMVLEKGFAVVLARGNEFVKDTEVSAVFFNKDWARRNPQTARDFVVAYIKATRDYHSALMGGKNRPEIVEMIIKHARLKEKALYEKMHWVFIDPDGKILKESLGTQQEWFYKNGFVPKKVEIESVIDDGYVKYALEQLGPYKP